MKFKILILLLVFLALRLPYLRLPLDRDEGGYAYVGWIWSAKLGIPYVSVFDQKPPLTYVPYAIASRLLGNSFKSVRIVALIYSLILTISFGTLAYQLLDGKAAFITILLFILYISAIGIEGTNFNTEMLLLMPLVVCFALYSRGKIFLAAFFGGLAILFKPVAAFPLFFLGIYDLFRLRSFKNVLSFGVGVSLPLTLVTWYFYRIGALTKLVTYLFYFNGLYIKSGFTSEYLCGISVMNFGCLISWGLRAPLVILPFIAVGFAIIVKYWRKRSHIWWIGVILFIGNLLAIKNAGSKDFPHYFLLLVPGLCLLFGLWFEKANRQGKIKKEKNLLMLLIIWYGIVEGYLHLSSPKIIQAAQFGSQANWMTDAVQVGGWVKTHMKQQDTLLVWANEPQIYFYTQRLAPGGFMHFYAFSYLPKLYPIWIEYLKNAPPDYIATYVDDPASYGDLEKLFLQLPHYKNIETIGRYNIFHLSP